MRLPTLTVLGFAAALALAPKAFAQDTAITGTTQPAMTPGDLEFVLKATAGGMAEINLGQIAQGRAGSERVRAFAQRMMADHGKANDALAELATARGTAPPNEPPADVRSVAQAMESYEGEDFDQVYVIEQVGAHAVAVALFRHAAEHAAAPELRAFASEHLPVIEGHYQEAQSLMNIVAEGG
jgi:putative membrane protein